MWEVTVALKPVFKVHGYADDFADKRLWGLAALRVGFEIAEPVNEIDQLF
jgi:hypothetical protein